jgi:hypothetical protein
MVMTATDDPTDHRLGQLAAMHVEAIAVAAFPQEAGYHLVIKQPRIENMDWAATAIAADHVVALDRHPLGVVNSVRRWGMLKWAQIEWAIVNRDETLSPEAQRLIAAAETPEERLLVLTWLRSRHLREFVAATPTALLIEYDALCADPLGETLRVWRHTGLIADTEPRRALDALLSKRDGPGEDSGSRFLHVHKDPLARRHAWRHELPDSIRRRLERFIRRHDLDIALPGAGLPELSATERLLARQADAKARQRPGIGEAVSTRSRQHRCQHAGNEIVGLPLKAGGIARIMAGNYPHKSRCIARRLHQRPDIIGGKRQRHNAGTRNPRLRPLDARDAANRRRQTDGTACIRPKRAIEKPRRDPGARARG